MINPCLFSDVGDTGSDMASTNKVLFICTGNTCRSPMAEGLFRKAVAQRDDIEVLGSAGVAAYDGDTMSHDTAIVLKANDASLTDFSSRAVTAEMLDDATHVFAMTNSHLHMLVNAFPDHAEKCYLVCDFIEFNGKVGVDVPDPIGQGPRAYNMVAQVLNHALPTLITFMDSEEG